MLSTILFCPSSCNNFYNNQNVIINNGATLQDPILLVKIPMGTQDNFAGNYRQFGHAVSKWFTIPVLDTRSRVATRFPNKIPY
jgi:hypothetical protein